MEEFIRPNYNDDARPEKCRIAILVVLSVLFGIGHGLRGIVGPVYFSLQSNETADNTPKPMGFTDVRQADTTADNTPKPMGFTDVREADTTADNPPKPMGFTDVRQADTTADNTPKPMGFTDVREADKTADNTPKPMGFTDVRQADTTASNTPKPMRFTDVEGKFSKSDADLLLWMSLAASPVAAFFQTGSTCLPTLPFGIHVIVASIGALLSSVFVILCGAMAMSKQSFLWFFVLANFLSSLSFFSARKVMRRYYRESACGSLHCQFGAALGGMLFPLIPKYLIPQSGLQVALLSTGIVAFLCSFAFIALCCICDDRMDQGIRRPCQYPKGKRDWILSLSDFAAMSVVAYLFSSGRVHFSLFLNKRIKSDDFKKWAHVWVPLLRFAGQLVTRITFLVPGTDEFKILALLVSMLLTGAFAFMATVDNDATIGFGCVFHGFFTGSWAFLLRDSFLSQYTEETKEAMYGICCLLEAFSVGMFFQYDSMDTKEAYYLMAGLMCLASILTAFWYLMLRDYLESKLPKPVDSMV